MHLPPAISSPTPPKRRQIARMGDISPCYRIAPHFLLLLWQKNLPKKKRVKCNARELIWGRSRVACRACEWKRRGWRIVCVQGASPHSTACQVRYLSASNRGTGEDRQHLLSEPNYLLSTKKEGEPAPQPGLSSHKYISGFEHYGSLEARPFAIYYLFIDVQQFCGQNRSLVGIGAGLERIHYQLVLCPAALWQFYDGGGQSRSSHEENYVLAWAVRNHSKSIYGTLNQISSGGDTTFHRVARSLSEGLPAVINGSVIWSTRAKWSFYW